MKDGKKQVFIPHSGRIQNTGQLVLPFEISMTVLETRDEHAFFVLMILEKTSAEA